jgi:hypothetical protein
VPRRNVKRRVSWSVKKKTNCWYLLILIWIKSSIELGISEEKEEEEEEEEEE